jgi:topoisomerase-4 subunit A
MRAGESPESVDLGRFVEKAYLDYSMTVILDRALPHLADGLKPVQRRILYAMHELGLGDHPKFKKSARTVGDVIGKFHPHGDQAAYEALVLMAQPFSCRYPLVTGQGNFGSPDNPKSFAAMRYTESRLSPYAELLLAELDQGTVDWVPNFDGTLEEPVLLPARMPWVLLNGSSGIAVGMATDIPPHNLGEIAQALIHLLDHPKAGPDALRAFIPGPDFPTEAEITTGADELAVLYAAGCGMVRARARYHREDHDLVVEALPYQVSGSAVLTELARLVEAGELPWVRDLRDESDQEHPTRLVITLREGEVPMERIFEHLCAVCDLERSYRVNFNVITPAGAPRVLGLADLLHQWLGFRLATLERLLRWQLGRVRVRLEVVTGLLRVHHDLLAVIRIIRESGEPREELMRVFGLTERQAEAVLDMRLRQLARLESLALEKEQETLSARGAEIEATLSSPARLRKQVRAQLVADRARFADPRRSPLVPRLPAERLSRERVSHGEAITVVLTRRGWIRTARGHEWDPKQATYRSGDGFLALERGDSRETLVLFDSQGRVYNLGPDDLPDRRSPGIPLTSRLDPPPDARFVALSFLRPDEPVLWADDWGYGLVLPAPALAVRLRRGRQLFRLPQGDAALAAAPLGRAGRVVLLGSAGRLLVIDPAGIPRQAQGRGVRLLGIPAPQRGEERLLAALPLAPGAGLRLVSGRRELRLSPAGLKAYHGDRGRRGRPLPDPWQRRMDDLAVEVIPATAGD